MDFSISDFVADLRCETPSAAAEVITHHQTMIKDKMISLKSRLKNVMEYKMSRLENRLKHAHPHAILNILLSNLASFQKRLSRCAIHQRLHELTNIHDFYLSLDENLMRMQQLLKEKVKEFHYRLDKSRDVMKVLNPKNVLERGYGYLETEQGKVVGSVKDFDRGPKGATFNLHFHDGKRKVKSDEN